MRDRPAGRIGSLDGLRGIAAAVVLVHHAFLTVPPLSKSNYGLAVPDSLLWLTNSPLHVIWAGREAVFVFFVLSGFVLTLPSLRRTQDWIAYFPSRAVRLYLPVTASLLVALALYVLVPRTTDPHQSLWVNAHDQTLGLRELFDDFTLISPTLLNSPLWSLTWEVVFSVIVPLFVSVAAVTVQRWWVTAIVGVLVSALGEYLHVPWLIYLPMFLIGSALAAGWERIREVPRGLGWGLLVASLLGISSPAWFPPPFSHPVVVQVVVLASSFTVVLLAGKWMPAERFLLGPVPRTLGRISFSLYLTHEPIAVSLANLLPVTWSPWLTVVVTIPLAIGMAFLFARFVELPAHRLAKAIAKRISTQRVGTPV
ncbi:acyltransferase [Curtobacterium pusillum]|uniref:Acyltransferase n=1 Tax=Curtobacterium pusillum TaxID=69373 RepID=A0ABX2M8K8_9MICO|nr:acyltransferase [Curtobacterium pusillum]NUU13959.1 acyltransferase [Curtobacterium pusillum]GLK31134.1 acyltransferase [Curtobacterium pusillum]